MRLWPLTRDDRGRVYPFRASAVQSRRERAKRSDVVPLALASVAGALFLATFIGLNTRVPDALQLVLAIAITAPIWYASAVWLEFRAIRVSTRLGRARGLCLACGYSIAGIEPQEDNRRVCPECGRAWEMDADAAASRA